MARDVPQQLRTSAASWPRAIPSSRPPTGTMADFEAVASPDDSALLSGRTDRQR